MRYTMKQKWFGLLSDFYITDDAGNEKYFVKCSKGFIWDSFSFQDTKGNELLLIEESSKSYYNIKRNGEFCANIWKREGWIFNGLVITLADESKIRAEGSITAHDYTFTKESGSKEVAKVSKAWVALTDTYGIEVNEGEDDLLILACVVLIDIFFHSMQETKTS